MQSSPPLPSLHARERSLTQSDYSLDMNALTLDTHSEPSSPLPNEPVDQVRSDEIDGPSDFTINMEKWMRGPLKDNASWHFGAMDDGLGISSAPAPQDTNVGVEKTSEEDVPAPETHDNLAAYTQSQQEHLQSNAGPQSDEQDGLRENSTTPRQTDVGDDSIWDPYHHTSSPAPAPVPVPALASRNRNTLLQPTVEDYNSELTPARPSRHTQQHQNAVPLSPGRPSSPTLSPIKTPSPAKTRTVPELRSPDEELAKARAELILLREAQAQTAETIDTWRRDLTSERNTRQTVETALEEMTQRFEQEMQTLRIAQDAHCAELDRCKSETRSAEEAQMAASELAQRLQKDLDEMQESEDAELHSLRWQQKQASEAEQLLRKNLQEAEEHAKFAESEHRDLHAELTATRQARDLAIEGVEAQQQRHSQSIADLRAQLAQSQATEATMKDEMATLRSIAPPAADMAHSDTSALEHALATSKAALTHYEEETHALRSELDVLRSLNQLANDNDDDDTTNNNHNSSSANLDSSALDSSIPLPTTTSAAQKQAASHEAALSALHNALETNTDARTELEREVARLRADVLVLTTATTDALQGAQVAEGARAAAESRVAELEADVAAAVAARAASQRQEESSQRERLLDERLGAAQRELGARDTRLLALETALAEGEAALERARLQALEAVEVNRAFETRVSEAVRRREEVWKRRIADVGETARRWEEQSRSWEERAGRGLREREVMGKALLRFWGREECGVDDKEQRFRYTVARNAREAV